MRVVVDTSGAQQQGFTKYEGPTPPVGLYKAVLKQAWWGMSKGANGKQPKPMLTCVFEFKAKSESKAKFDGFPLFFRVTHQDSTLWKMQQLFVGLGQSKKAAINVTDKDGPFGKVVTSIGRAQVGKAEILIKTKMEKYQGATRPGVDTFSPLPGTVEEVDDEIDGEEVTSFEASAKMTDEAMGSWQGSDEDQWGDDFQEAGSTEDPPF